MNQRTSVHESGGPFDSDIWQPRQNPSAKFARPDSVTIGTPLAVDDTIQMMGEEILNLAERIARLEQAAAHRDAKTAELLRQLARLIEDFSDNPTAEPIPAAEPEINQDAEARVMRSLRRGFDETPPVNQVPAAKTTLDMPSVQQPIAEDQPADNPVKRHETRLEAPLITTPPEIDIPAPEQPNWNVWLEAWVLAEQRADMLKEDFVPQVSALIFTPGGGQDIFDTWRSLWAGRELLVEAKVADIKDEQIKELIDATLARYERELELVRKKSSWHAPYHRLEDSMKALAAIAQGDSLDAVIKGQDALEDWRDTMDRDADWFVDDDGYQEKIALAFALLHDKLSDRPGSRQSQFSIQSKADMVAYNSLRTIETFLAKMNVQPDKELAIGKPYEQLQNSKLRDHQKKSTNMVTPKSADGLKISRILSNRWILVGPGNREIKELIKPSYELE